MAGHILASCYITVSTLTMAAAAASDAQPTIDGQTHVPLSALALLLNVVVAATWWVATFKSKSQETLRSLRERIDELERHIRSLECSRSGCSHAARDDHEL